MLPHDIDTSWLYGAQHGNTTDNHHHNSLTQDDHLQEPVPFEDFKFSFGLDPDFSMPIPLNDMPPMLPPDPLLFSDHPSSIAAYQHSTQPPAQPPAWNTTSDPLADTNGGVLDENEKAAFSNFLDSFFLDPQLTAEPLPSHLPSLYDLPDSSASSAPAHTAPTGSGPQFGYHNNNEDEEDDEERRRASILQSLDEQKRLHRRLNVLATTMPQNNSTGSTSPAQASPSQHQQVYLQERNSVPAPYIKKKRPSTTPSMSADPDDTTVPGPPPAKRSKPHRELLTEEEKRANHIASEQKRRSTIRNGFKDLTDLVPTLKNINNSKSTVLFKAVDFIRYLEKRNRGLRDKIHALDVRVQVEGRRQTGQTISSARPTSTSSSNSNSSNSSTTSSISSRSDVLSAGSASTSFTTVSSSSTSRDYAHTTTNSHSNGGCSNSSSSTATVTPFTSSPTAVAPITSPTSSSSSSSSPSSAAHSGLPPAAMAALLAHKSQQQQLLQLQEQLQFHQRLLSQQQELKDRSSKRYQSDAKQNNPKSAFHSTDSKMDVDTVTA